VAGAFLGAVAPQGFHWRDSWPAGTHLLGALFWPDYKTYTPVIGGISRKNVRSGIVFSSENTHDNRKKKLF
jgi:hypothetical protein